MAVAIKRRKIIRSFNQAAAHSPETARSLQDLGITRGHMFNRMIKGGVIKEHPDGRLWLDQGADAAFHRRALMAVAIAVGVAAVAVVVMVLLAR